MTQASARGRQGTQLFFFFVTFVHVGAGTLEPICSQERGSSGLPQGAAAAGQGAFTVSETRLA